jgi:hypothetical protein
MMERQNTFVITGVLLLAALGVIVWLASSGGSGPD